MSSMFKNTTRYWNEVIGGWFQQNAPDGNSNLRADAADYRLRTPANFHDCRLKCQIAKSAGTSQGLVGSMGGAASAQKIKRYNMKNFPLAFAAIVGSIIISSPTFAQSTAGVDPACIIKNTDGSQTIDKSKCPDGMSMATGTTVQSTDTTASTTPAANSLIVPMDSFSGAKVMSASDFVGKRVYSKNGDDIGEVNDIILTANGGIQAVVLGVGGFLGMGEKDVAVSMASIEMMQDGNAVRLVVDGTKEQFKAAPTYDRTTRNYMR
jgi:sporulation protein YlmC with PRC-barrel domain